MPVTIKPAPHGADIVKGLKGASDPVEVFKSYLRGREKEKCLDLFQSSLDAELSGDSRPKPVIQPSKNGFVRGAIDAYSNHRHLVIRPEDVWFTVVSQFSFYVNANAEAVRKAFVAHEGKKKLVVNMPGGRYSVDYGVFAQEMASLIDEKVADRDLKWWVMPDFSTTTASDRVVASVLLMGLTQKYFDFECCLLCGLPSVTLLGKKADWKNIYIRLGKLLTYGEQPKRFCQLVRPVIARFIKSFEEPESKDTTEFWQQIASRKSGGSGPSYYTGWITAFCFWDADGKCLHKSNYDFDQLKIDGIEYPMIETKDVPAGYTTVPVEINDNGCIVDSMMVAGSVGIRYSYSGDEARGEESDMNTISPETGWCIFEAKSEAELDAKDAAQKKYQAQWDTQAAEIKREYDERVSVPRRGGHHAGGVQRGGGRDRGRGG